MSLVSEALKKAEREAAAREAREKGQPAPFEVPLQPYRSRLRATRGGARGWLFVALGGAATIGLLAVLWWSRPQEAPARQERLAPSGPVATSHQPRASEGLSSPTAPAAAGLTAAASAQAAAPPSASEPAATPLPTPPLPKTTLTAPQPQPSASEPALPKAAAAAAARSSPAAESTVIAPGDYLRRVDFPDGSKLELGGIVYSETSPFAYLNGRLVGVGEFVEGRRIDRIERDRVHLSGDAGAITLRLKAP